ncbi:hypothetical protein CI109_106281 [Kwoniella shandongensis]|uniref:FAD dependent oxidoreductase domain-containing protein n=1 Tax=Kwoniella shandongensis TaxID=1734106 RepID=A0A5M6BTK0_9TREE|nr:uncharacterized protein CI109_006725 [Kwoniella shandongensis]KAA5524925.1 hypothetical protein CI109_006725 [Kwoniella shandongensis]
MSSFPQPFISSTSHWQATNRGPSSLYNHNKDVSPPSHADILIVGGGMMGSALSYFLTRKGAEGDGKKVVLVEAKDIGSGASGRNGGHLGPATAHGYYNLLQPPPVGTKLSSKEAVRVIQAERDNMELITKIIHDEGITDKVDLWRGHLCEVHQKAEARPMKEMYDAWLAARKRYGYADDTDTTWIDDPAEAKRVSRFKNVASVQLRPAGSVHSHKLCTELARLALKSPHSDYDIYSWCPVSTITPSKKGGWTVKTAKGTIQAKRVVLCVNAYTKDFFPEDELLHSHILPQFTQLSLITPPETFSGEKALQYTYNMTDEGYLIQTPMGGIVVGGGLDPLVRAGKIDPGVGNSLDDSITHQVWDEYLARYCPDHFEGWGPEGKGQGETRSWSGILTRVKDILPVVGPVPDREGLFLAAGFHGHGMSRIFSVGQALAATLQTGKWDESLLPRSFELTTERLERARDYPCERPDEFVNMMMKEEKSSTNWMAEKEIRYAEKVSQRKEAEKKQKEKDSWCVIA